MDSIVVGFSKPKTWKPFSWLIMTGYGIPYDHVYIKFHSDSFDRDIIYQASELMVNFMGKQFTDANTIVDEFEVEITPENKLALIQFAIDNAGKPYGIMEAFGLAIVRIAELFGKKINNPFSNNGSTYVCSVLVGYILAQYAGIDVPDQTDNITPKEVYDYLMLIKAKKIQSTR
jgi:hypothetical protein